MFQMKYRCDRSKWLKTGATRPCLLCGGTESTPISSRMQLGLDLTTVICSRCGFVFTDPMPDRETYEEFYVKAYADFYGHITPPPPANRVPREPAAFRTRFERIEKVRPLAGARLLELGPGQGLFLWWAQRRGCSVLGIEPSPEFCSVLAEAGLPHRQCTLEDVDPSQAGHFDLIAMFQVLEHFFDPNAALKHCRALLAPGGLLAVEVPNVLKPFRSLDRYFLRYVHPSTFSPATLQAMLEKHGFQPLHADTAGSDWRTPQSICVLAQKLPECPQAIPIPKQLAAEVVAFLCEYRVRWRWRIAPRWYARAFWLRGRRIALRPARALWHLIRKQGASSAS